MVTSNVTESGTEHLRDVNKQCHIPLYEELDTPRLIKWGNTNGVDILIPTSLFDNAYDEIVLWRKNTFLVLYGKVGGEFIDTLSNLIKQWNDCAQLQCIALKAFFVLLALGLQKPSRTSKSKDHQYCLKERLELWKEGQIEKLLREGRLLQSRLSKAKSQSPQDKARIFANLIMDGQINSAVHFLTENGNNGILPLNTDVIQELKAKDPSDEALLYGPIDYILSVIFH